MSRSLETPARTIHRRNANFLGFLWCGALMVYALYVQHALHEDPCPLCVLQRVAVIVTGVLFLAAFLHNPGRTGGRTYAVLIALPAFAGVAVAARHVWIIAQPPGTVAECGASLDYMLDVLPWQEVMAKVLSGSGECAQVTWSLLGLNMPAWVLLNLAGLAALGVAANVGLPRR